MELAARRGWGTRRFAEESGLDQSTVKDGGGRGRGEAGGAGGSARRPLAGGGPRPRAGASVLLSRCYLDTNFLYAHLRSRRGAALGGVEGWRAAVLDATDGGSVISPLVLDELAYRLILAWLRDDGESDPLSAYRRDPGAAMKAARRRLATAWRAVDSLGLELQPTDQAVVDVAKSLMARPGLAPRDAFHAGHALEAGCDAIATSDPGFDDVPGLRRLGPDL